MICSSLSFKWTLFRTRLGFKSKQLVGYVRTSMKHTFRKIKLFSLLEKIYLSLTGPARFKNCCFNSVELYKEYYLSSEGVPFCLKLSKKKHKSGVQFQHILHRNSESFTSKYKPFFSCKYIKAKICYFKRYVLPFQ